jgi:leucyl aminopeptidase
MQRAIIFPPIDKLVKPLHVYIFQRHVQLVDTLKKHGLSAEDTGVKVVVQGTKMMFLCIDVKATCLSLNELASKFSQQHKEPVVCFDLRNISNKYKLAILQVFAKHMYIFEKYKMKPSPTTRIHVRDYHQNKSLVTDILDQIHVTNVNRDFQNEPANKVTPTTFCSYVRDMFAEVGESVHVKVYGHDDLERMGLNLIHQMGKASVHKSSFLVIEYVYEKDSPTFCLIGKGVCYDTGGLNLKPDRYMTHEMKADKTGGTTVASVILYAAKTHMKCSIVGLIPLIDNAISGDALHPGDIVKSYAGKTVEILNTDAEGRVVMADALEYSTVSAKQLNIRIDYIFDLATLTGQADTFVPDVSCVHFTTNSYLSKLLVSLGESICERTFGLPAYTEYVKFTRSDVADYKNLDLKTYRNNSTFMAAMFLLNFVPKSLEERYIHFDITNNFTQHLSNGSSTLLIINLLKFLILKK